MPDDVAIRLRRRREELGLSLADLEKLCGLNRSTIQRYETKGTEKVGLTKIQALAGALQVSPGYLLGWEGKTISSKYFVGMDPLLKEIGYEIKYNSKTEGYELHWSNDKLGSNACMLSDEEIKIFKNSIIDYVKFKIKDLIADKTINVTLLIEEGDDLHDIKQPSLV